MVIGIPGECGANGEEMRKGERGVDKNKGHD
jgi:hypothetical protein